MVAKSGSTRKPRTPAAPADETKADKFRRLAKARVPKALKAISNIGNLANKAGYDFTADQVRLIDNALVAATDALSERFKAALAGKPAAAVAEFEI